MKGRAKIGARAANAAGTSIGEQLFRFYPREVRRLLVDAYEIRYEIQNDDIYILRIWHSREAHP